MSSGAYYPYRRSYASKYTFTSVGKKKIVKQVVFTHTGTGKIVNMGFGDVLPDGSIDDKANSNNGDIVKVLATTVQILMDYTSRFPDLEIFFSGSTEERTKLYTRILNTYYNIFSNEFIIKGIARKNTHYTELPFKPGSDVKFVGFIIKRIS